MELQQTTADYNWYNDYLFDCKTTTLIWQKEARIWIRMWTFFAPCCWINYLVPWCEKKTLTISSFFFSESAYRTLPQEWGLGHEPHWLKVNKVLLFWLDGSQVISKTFETLWFVGRTANSHEIHLFSLST